MVSVIAKASRPPLTNKIVAGPADLARSVRKVVRSPRISSPIGILRGKPTVSLHVEKFGM